MARGLGARRSSELYGGLLGNALRDYGLLVMDRARNFSPSETANEFIQELFPGFGAYEIVDGKMTFPEARAPEGGVTGLLGELFPGPDIGGLLGTFGGKMAKTADLDMLKLAEAAEARGLPAERVFDATGWFRGADGKWRFEIDDSGAASRSYQLTPEKAYEQAVFDAALVGDPAGIAKVQAMRPYSTKTKKELVAEYKRTGEEIFNTAKAGDIKGAIKLDRDRAALDGMLGAMRSNYGPFSGFLKHPDLGAAYPDVYRMHTRISPDDMDGYLGKYLAGDQYQGEQIVLGEKPSWSKPKSTALHEAMHGIQRREGFAGGGSTAYAEARGYYNDQLSDWLIRSPENEKVFDVFRRAGERLDYGDLSDEAVDAFEAAEKQLLSLEGGKMARDAYYVLDPPTRKAADNLARLYYKRLAGEVEARNVQKRMGLLADDRRMLPPWMTEDVPRDQQIVRFDGGVSASLPKVRKVVRYETESGRGLMNNDVLDRMRLTDDEEDELMELLDFGLQQPRDVPAGAAFAFTEDGEKQHRRLLELLKKASKEKVIRREYSIGDSVWESPDGQVAFLPD